ncbi:BnaA04g12530D [Brassica napus]|uniref:BnaA04g12530D protein n=1 Tax=Brassica napus TaxID=3708 RepID=A0A078FU17_BRANA|nr:BnaA04g12530D [Brassica napus]
MRGREAPTPAARMRTCRRRWLPSCRSLLEICLRRVSNGGNLSFSGFVTRVCSLVGGREKRPYQVGDVSVSRGCYSGLCSNGGGDDLAPAIDLAGKDFSRVQDGGGEECV